MWETQHNIADWDCFKTLILLETWKTRNRPRVDFCAFSEVKRSCQQVECARNRLQFHTVPTEAEVISLEASLRMDGIPALDLWDLVIEVCRSSPNQTNKKPKM